MMLMRAFLLSKRHFTLFGLILLGLGHSLVASAYTCEDFRTEGRQAATSRLSLRVRGNDGRFHTISVAMGCRNGEDDVEEFARITRDSGFAASFASGPGQAPRVRLTFSSMSPEDGGPAEPELNLHIGDRYRVKFSWNERETSDGQYRRSFLWFRASSTRLRQGSTPSQTVSLEVDGRNSRAKVRSGREFRDISLVTPTVLRQGDENRFMRDRAAQYAQSRADRDHSVRQCGALRENPSESGRFEGSCNGTYDFLVHGGELRVGRFQCDFVFERKSGVSEVISEDCGLSP